MEEVGKAALVLDASNNRLASLPPALASLPSLARLVVPHNRLQALLPQLAALTNLKACPEMPTSSLRGRQASSGA